MFISGLCSWCDRMNPSSERFCSCGHEAHVGRLDCRCGRCVAARHRTATAAPPVLLGGAIAEALAALRRGDPRPLPQPEDDMARKRKTAAAPEPAPETRDVKRTPVPADLADKIRSVDEALLTAFGFDLCYLILARDGIIAASNARDGYLPPIVAPAPPASN